MTAARLMPTTPGSSVRDDTTGYLWGLSSSGWWVCLDGDSDGWGEKQLWCVDGHHCNACYTSRPRGCFTWTVVSDAGAAPVAAEVA